MRNKSEKRTIRKSVRLSPLQFEEITEKAQAKGMSLSSYMVDCALHNNQGITPKIAVKMQEMVNMALEFADTLDENNYIRKEEFKQKASAFSEICTPLTPQEKYNQLENNIGLFIEGGAEIWESLK